MGALIEKIKNNRVAYEIGVWLVMKYADFVTLPFTRVRLFLRNKNLCDRHIFDPLKSLRNKYEGERCFIIATGPSLTYEDLEKLKNEYTFCVNSIVKILDRLDFVPNFIGIQDAAVFDKIGDMIEQCGIQNVFLTPKLYRRIKKKNKNYYQFPHVDLTGDHPERRSFKTSFSDDITMAVYDGNSITYSLLQIAVYMGFKEIYLLGCDCSYDVQSGKHHFVESGHYDKQAATVGQRMIFAYSVGKKWLEENRPDIRVFNSTRGGMLEVFERRTLDEVF